MEDKAFNELVTDLEQRMSTMNLIGNETLGQPSNKLRLESSSMDVESVKSETTMSVTKGCNTKRLLLKRSKSQKITVKQVVSGEAALVSFDDFEKAHEQFFNTFRHLLDPIYKREVDYIGKTNSVTIRLWFIGTRVPLGQKNKLASVRMSGGVRKPRHNRINMKSNGSS